MSSTQSSSDKGHSSSAGQRQHHQPHYVSDASSGQRQRSRSSNVQQRGTKRQRRPPPGPVRKWLIPAVALTLWMVVSSLVILLNKRILVEDGFSYPLTLSALGQFASALAGMLSRFTPLVHGYIQLTCMSRLFTRLSDCQIARLHEVLFWGRWHMMGPCMHVEGRLNCA